MVAAPLLNARAFWNIDAIVVTKWVSNPLIVWLKIEAPWNIVDMLRAEVVAQLVSATLNATALKNMPLKLVTAETFHLAATVARAALALLNIVAPLNMLAIELTRWVSQLLIF